MADLPVTKLKRKTLTTFEDGWANIGQTDWLIEDHIPASSLIGLIGAPSTFKSFIALDMALSIATGTDYHGHKVKQGAICYVCGEGVTGVYKRAFTWLQNKNIEPNDNLWIHNGAIDLYEEGGAYKLASRLSESMPKPPRFIVLDTLARMAGGMSENDNSEMSAFITALTKELQDRFGCTVVLVHHTAKGTQTARGASALLGAIDAEYTVRRIASPDGDDALPCVSLRCSKMKDHDEPEALKFGLDAHPLTLPDGIVESNLIPRSLSAEVITTNPSERLTLNRSSRKMIHAIYDAIDVEGNHPDQSALRDIYVSEGLAVSNLSAQIKSLCVTLAKYEGDTLTRSEANYDVLMDYLSGGRLTYLIETNNIQKEHTDVC